MKQVFYDVIYDEPGGPGAYYVFYTRKQAEEFTTDRAGLRFNRIERRYVNVTQEKLLRAACVICGEPVDYYESSWRENAKAPTLAARACKKHSCPPGFKYFTDHG